MPAKIEGGVKVAILDFNLQKHKTQMGVQVVVTDTKQVEEIRQRELGTSLHLIIIIIIIIVIIVVITFIMPACPPTFQKS